MINLIFMFFPKCYFSIAPLVTAALIGAGADIFSGLSAQKGQEKANRAEMEFNALEAQKNRDFEERMFGTRYQTTRKDLEAAGYNPLLAMGLNPSTPSGAVASAHPKSTTEVSSKIFSNSAKNAMSLVLDKVLLDKVKAEAGTAKATEQLVKQDADIATSPGGRALAKWRYFLDKSGIGRGAQNLMNIFGARSAAKAFKPNISFAENEPGGNLNRYRRRSKYGDVS